MARRDPGIAPFGSDRRLDPVEGISAAAEEQQRGRDRVRVDRAQRRKVDHELGGVARQAGNRVDEVEDLDPQSPMWDSNPPPPVYKTGALAG